MSDGSPAAPGLHDPPLSSSTASTTSSAAGGSESGRENAQTPGFAETTPEFRACYMRHSRLLDLLAAYDSMVYMELAAIYYMDTSTVLVILRTLLHLTQISHSRALAIARAPSSLNLKPSPTNVFVVLLINLIAILVHVFMGPATASEETRGYLHGHLIVDLIGQKAVGGWVGKAKLCIMDLVVCVLQVFAVAIVTESEKVERAMELAKHEGANRRNAATRSERNPDESQSGYSQSPGLRAFAPRRNWQPFQSAEADQNVDIELQEFSPFNTSSGFEAGPEGSASRGDDVESQGALSAQLEQAEAHNQGNTGDAGLGPQVSERIAIGENVLVNLRISDLVRDHFWQWRNRGLSGAV